MVAAETNEIQAQAVSSLGELLCLWQLLWFGIKFCFCICALRFTQPTKKHWKCLWLFTLETFLTVYQQRPPDGYHIMHGLHSSKKFLEFGLLCYHSPLRHTPDLKEAFTKLINLLFFFFLIMVTFLKWKTCTSSSTIYLSFNKYGLYLWYLINSLLRISTKWVPWT